MASNASTVLRKIFPKDKSGKMKTPERCSDGCDAAAKVT